MTAITLSRIVKWEAPDGDVRLCDGGFVDYSSERYTSDHTVFGVVERWPEFKASIGDSAEDGTIVFSPAPDATLSDWWRTDLSGTRMRFWEGEVDADHVTLSSPLLLADMLVDTVTRSQTEDGDQLALTLVGMTERLFIIDEANVCSDRFHQSVYSGELGFANCTDIQGKFPWGTQNESRESADSSEGKKAKKKNKNG